MADCHSLFLSFNSIIALNSTHKAKLRTSRNAIRERIRRYFRDKQNGFFPKFHGQGSFMMNTIIDPLDGEFDVDDGIYFIVDEKPSQSVGTFHSWICTAVNGHTQQKPIDKITCVRLVYAGQYHLDLPIYYVIEGQCPRLAHKNKGWIDSDPREFIKWLQEN
jgi:Second Messenger Oligonucleotide or Dinucleotide Synthetase domain